MKIMKAVRIHTYGGPEVLRFEGGILVSTVAPPSPEEAAKHGARAAHIFVQPNSAELTQIGRLVDDGKVKPFIQTVLPLSELAKHRN